MTRFGVPGQNQAPLAYADGRLSVVPMVSAPRAPLTTDKKFPMWTEWRVSKGASLPAQEGDFWKLIRFDGSGDAIWVKINEASTGPIITLSDTANTKVESDATGNIQLEGGSGITVTSDAGNNKLTFALSGGSTAVDSVDVDFNTGPGVDPVVPDANGLISIYGNTVTNGTNASAPVATHSRAVNQFHIDVQLSAAVTGAPADPNDAGICSFDDVVFAVDGNGHVTANAATETSSGVVELATTAEVQDGTYGTTQVVSAGKISAMFAIPPAIGGTTPNSGDFTNLTAASSSGVPAIFTQTTATTTAVNTASRHRHGSSGTPAAGFGASIELQPHNAANTYKTAARLAGVWEDATDSSEDSFLQVSLLEAASQIQAVKLYPTYMELRAASRYRIGASGVDFMSGSGSPDTVVTAAKGSLYMRTDGSSTSTRAYINTDGATAWTNITTAS